MPNLGKDALTKILNDFNDLNREANAGLTTLNKIYYLCTDISWEFTLH